MRHDIAYEEADKGIGTRHDADRAMLNELSELNNKDLNWNEFLAKYFTKGIIGVKYKLGLGYDEAENCINLLGINLNDEEFSYLISTTSGQQT